METELDDVVDEMLHGYLKAMQHLVSPTVNPRVLKYRGAPVRGKVGIVTGGTSGTSPLLSVISAGT